jgi:hypothetical protein
VKSAHAAHGNAKPGLRRSPNAAAVKAEFAAWGYSLLASRLSREDLSSLLDRVQPEGTAGVRRRGGAIYAARNVLWERAGLAALLDALGLDRLAGEALGAPAFPINALFLDKNSGANWKVPAHQDLMMPVSERREAAGFSHWSEKLGVVHVEPPARVLDRLVALRVHFDDCDVANGALAVVPGSHRRGKFTDSQLEAIAPESYVVCEADAGEVLLMKPLLVHRSAASRDPGRRRVLHVVYAGEEPGGGVRWKRPA